jgi:hypothetical protein
VDTGLADAITGWGPLSAAKLETTVDAVIDRHDPAAVLAYRAAARGRDIGVGKHDDTTGTVSLWGRLQGTDGELLKRRLQAMATAVCRTDPRTLGERRSDALGVVMAGGTVLACRCEDPDCPNTGTDARAEAVVIHLLTTPPNTAIWTTRSPTGAGPPIQPTCAACAENITCSRPSGPEPPAGRTSSCPTAPSSGGHPPDTSTAAHSEADSCSRTGTPPPPTRTHLLRGPAHQVPTAH